MIGSGGKIRTGLQQGDADQALLLRNDAIGCVSVVDVLQF